MTNDQFYDFLKSNGFTVTDTGGGCTAWHKTMPDDCFILVSQELTHEMNDDWLAKGLDIHVGVFWGDEWLETDHNSAHASIDGAAAAITELLEGAK